MNTLARDRYVAEFARVSHALPGGRLPWLQQVRGDALERFAQAGFPGARDEDWKYTSLAALEKKTFVIQPEGAGADTATAAWVTGLAMEPHLLVFLDGRYSAALSLPGKLPAGVTLQSLAGALEHASDVLEPYLADTHCQTVFGALNTALMSDGAYLHVQRGIALEEPVHLLFLASCEHAAMYPRNLIVAEPGSRVTVIEHYAGIHGVEYFTNAVTQIFAADNAMVEHCKLQQEATRSFHVAGIHAMQDKDSQLVSHSISLGAALARNDITSALDATGCGVTLNGLYLASGRQHVDHHTRIDHNRAHGSSREYYRGVLDGSARAVFNGKVIVHPDAQKTDAHQANHNLLLSREAEVDSKPELQIYADDVKCTHGATVGQLDDTQLFYLRSRGIEEAAARNLLVRAFAHDVIDRIRVASLRRRLEQILLVRMPHGMNIEELT